jgi:hypothetical protein
MILNSDEVSQDERMKGRPVLSDAAGRLFKSTAKVTSFKPQTANRKL